MKPGQSSLSAEGRSLQQSSPALGPVHTGRVAAQHSAKNGKILHYLHSAALCVNIPTDYSGFHEVTSREMLHSVLLMRSV